MDSKLKILLGILVVGIILIGSWWTWKNYQPVKEKYCRQDNDCIFGWPEKCIMGCVHKDTPKRTPCLLVKPAPWSPYIWGNMPCKCVGGKCVEDKESFCQKACKDWKDSNCADGIPKSAFLAMKCEDKIECECLKQEKYKIYLRSRQFIPEPGISDTLKSMLANTSYKRMHVILQFYHIPNNEERSELSNLNVTLCGYVPNNAYFASIPTKYLTDIYNLSFVRWIGEILPEDKISRYIRNGTIGDLSLIHI